MNKPDQGSMDHLTPGRQWRAGWISHPSYPDEEYVVLFFRRRLSLPGLPGSFVVHVSADNRYRLFVNGTPVSRGPARGDLPHWRYESLDISPYLKQGENLIAALVWNFVKWAPAAQLSYRTGFLLEGDGEAAQGVNTGERAGWKVLRSSAHSPVFPDAKEGFFIPIGAGEQLDGSRYPWGWETAGYDDTAWDDAVQISPALSHGSGTGGSKWLLVPREIPAMEETPQKFSRVVRTRGIAVPETFPGQGCLVVPPHTSCSLVLDQGRLTTAYPEITVSGGRDAQVRFAAYAEAGVAGKEKGNRGDLEGKEISSPYGIYDCFLPDGGDRRVFMPLWWRSFRYMTVEVVTGAEQLVIESLGSRFTGYPFVQRGRFTASDASLEEIWRVGWHTARLCAHETYLDCPSYEQLQYVGDTRIQALVSLFVGGDDRLMKNAIRQFHDSRMPEGLTHSQYPARYFQIIPPFSLIWIMMIHDYRRYRDNPAFVASFLPAIAAVLAWFLERLDPATGLYIPSQWWNFVDWAPVSTGEAEGGSAIISLQLVQALDMAAEMESCIGDPRRGSVYRKQASCIRRAVRKSCWDRKRKLLADTPAKTVFSQHAQALAVLADAVPASRQKPLIERTLSKRSLVQCTSYFSFYLLAAVRKAGLADRYLSLLDPWRAMLKLGLTTWAEKPEPTRSDCHAWSAHPTYDLLATVCGIDAAGPGFDRVRIEPHPGNLAWVEGAVPHPRGMISVRIEQRQEGGGRIEISLPAGLEGEFVWGGTRQALVPGRQTLELKVQSSGKKR